MSDLDALAREHSDVEEYILAAFSDKYFNLKRDKDTVEFLKIVFDGAHKDLDMAPMQVTEKKATYCGRCGHTHVKGTPCPRPFKEGLSTYGDDAYFVVPNKGKMKKEEILKAVKEVLAEGTKTVIVGNPAQTAQAIQSDPDIDSAAKTAAVSTIKTSKAGDKVEVPTKSMEEDHHEDPNDESSMAKSQLYHIANYAIELMKMIQDGTQLDAWVQSKITKAADYIDSVKHYMEGEMYLAGTTEEPVNEDFEKFDTLKMAIVQHEKGSPYYDKTRLINIFNQLDSPDQERAKREYSQYFGKSVKEVSKKKLDPVGHEDKDIDNDGDVDKTDKYLKKRRVKIGKAIASHKK